MIRDAEPTGEIVLYQTEDGRTRLECRFADETLWLSQALMAELFQISVPTVNEHLKGIYADGELDAGATIRKFRIVRREGTRQVAREIEHYSLDAILAVGYRVRSPRGTQFRIWATERLSEYLVKGFTMDDERLRNPPVEGVRRPRLLRRAARAHPGHPGQRAAGLPPGARRSSPWRPTTDPRRPEVMAFSPGHPEQAPLRGGPAGPPPS